MLSGHVERSTECGSVEFFFFLFLSESRGTPRELTSHLTGRGGVLDWSVKWYCVLHTFSVLALQTSLMLDHITRRLGPTSDHRKQFASSSAAYTLTLFS